MKREAGNFGGSVDRIDHDTDNAGRKRRKGKNASTILGLLAAMAVVVILTASFCAWLDKRAQQNVVGTLAGTTGGDGQGGSSQDGDGQGGSSQDGDGQGGSSQGGDGQGGSSQNGDGQGGSSQDGAGQGGTTSGDGQGGSNQDGNDGEGIVNVGGSAVNGDNNPSGSGDDAVGAAGSVVYSQEELENILSTAVEEAQQQAQTEILDSIKNSLDAGDSLLQALRRLYKDELVVYSGGKYNFVPINRELKLHDLTEENLNILETGEYQYVQNGEVVSYKGIDVSQHQGAIDWKQVADDGVKFAFIRVAYRGYGTSGKLMADANFDANIKGATENGIKVGVYMFSQAITPEEAVEEANFVLEKIAPYNVECPVVFDVETISGANGRMNEISLEDRTNYALLFCQTIENAGYRPMLYYNTEMGAVKLDLETLEGYDKWFAAYTDEFYYPYAYDVWQYSSTGSVAGIKGNVDLNISFVPLWEKKQN